MLKSLCERCHSERSEESRKSFFLQSEIPRFARNDKLDGFFSTPLDYDLVQWIFDNALGMGGFEARNDLAHRFLLDDRVHSHPLGITEL